MLSIPINDELKHVAQRMVWFKEPEAALKDPYTFMAHVMTYGMIEDVIIVQKYLGRSAFNEALDHMPPGIIDQRSWVYWHVILNREPAPDLPKRTF